MTRTYSESRRLPAPSRARSGGRGVRPSSTGGRKGRECGGLQVGGGWELELLLVRRRAGDGCGVGPGGGDGERKEAEMG